MSAALLIAALSAHATAVDFQQPARAITAGSFSDADYPAEALRAHAEGTSVVDVDITAGGQVASCRVAQSAGNAALDARTCQVFSERFRFAAGSSASSRRLRINWQLPAAPAAVPFAPARTSVETVVGLGRANYCQASTEGQPPAALFAIGCDAGARSGPAPGNWQTRRLDTVTLTADGRAPSALPRPRATVLMRYQVSFDVAADGSVTRCEPSADADEVVAAAARQRCEALANNGAPTFTPSGTAHRGTIEALTTLQAR